MAVRAEGAAVFDLFGTWRMDSGDYAEMVSRGVGWGGGGQERKELLSCRAGTQC